MRTKFYYIEATKESLDYHFTEFYVNEVKYRMEFYINLTLNSTKIYTSISSGKKRKLLNIFEEKGIKNNNGLKPLIIAKNIMYEFGCYYKKEWINYGDVFLCIQWSDNRRKNIYTRLLKEGFRFTKVDNTTTLIKNIGR